MVQGRRKQPLTCVCEQCQKEFETLGSRRATYCGSKCRDRARYSRDRDKRLKAVREYREANRDEVNERQKLARKMRPTHYRDLAAKSYQKHREQRIEDALKWQKNNPDRVAVREAKRRSRTGSFTITSKFQARALERNRNCCYYCGQLLNKVDRRATNGLHWDHVLPLHLGGKDSEGNLVPSCSTCNLRKGSKLLMEVPEIRGWAIEKEQGSE